MVDLGTTSVLVADDEPSTRAMVARHLRSIGYKVVEAVDGDEAFSLALEHLPDLVVLDVMMPGMSGWEVCRRIRETVSLAHTGVVMLTGIGESLNEITSPLYGADAYLDKPFEFSVLDRTIAETLEGRRGLVGRPDGADVEIVQTMGNDDDASDAPPAKPKRTRRAAVSDSDGESPFSNAELDELEGTQRPVKKRTRKASQDVEAAQAEPTDAALRAKKGRGKPKADMSIEVQDAEASELPAARKPAAKKTKAGKKAAGKKKKPVAAKKKAGKKVVAKKASAKGKAVATPSGKAKKAKTAAKKKVKKKTSAPAKKAPRKVVAKAKAKPKGKKAKAAALPKKVQAKGKKAGSKKPSAASSAKVAKKSAKGKTKKKASRR